MAFEEGNQTIGEMRRREVKQNMQRLRSGQGMVDDVEKQQFRQAAQKQADAVIGAQQAGLARQAMGGGQNAGALQAQQQKLAKASADAAVKASGQEKQYTAALDEQRKASAMAATERLQQKRMQDLQMALDTWNSQSEAFANVVQGFGDAVPM